MHALAFDALGPDRIGGRHVHDDARVARFSEAPLDRELILFVALLGAEKTAGLASANEKAVFDGPSVLGGGFRVDDPANGVLAVEKFGFGTGRDRLGGEGIDEGGRQ